MQVTMTVNGTEVTRDVEPRLLLVHFLRDTLGLTGTHWGCDTSNCGTCVVLVDGEPVKSCTQLAAMTASTVQDLTGSPSISTTQTPQLLVSQPQWVPVRPSVSRRKCTRSSLGSTSRVTSVPLTVMVTCIVGLLRRWERWPRHGRARGAGPGG